MSIIKLPEPWCFFADESITKGELEELQEHFVNDSNHDCDWQINEWSGIDYNRVSCWHSDPIDFSEYDDEDNVTVYTIEQLRDIVAEHLAKQPVKKLEDGVVYHVKDNSDNEWLMIDKAPFVHINAKYYHSGKPSWSGELNDNVVFTFTKANPAQIAHYEACVKAGKYVETESVKFDYVKCVKSEPNITASKSFIVGKVYTYPTAVTESGDKWGSLPMQGRIYSFEPSTEAEYLEQNQAALFVVGKWYKYNRHVGKFSGYVHDLFTVSEYIYNNKHCITHANWGGKGLDNKRELIEDLSEIQKFLPEGHPDKIAKVYLDDKGRPLKEFKVGNWYTSPRLAERMLLNGNKACYFRVKSCSKEGSSCDYYYNHIEFDKIADKDWNIEDNRILQSNTDIDQEMVKVFPIVKSERYIETMKFFEQLREPERSEAIANYDEDYDSQIVGELYTALTCAFDFEDSKEGYDYWIKIRDDIEYGSYFKEEPWVAQVGDWVYVLEPMSSCLLVGDIVRCDSHGDTGNAHFKTHRYNNITPDSYLLASCYRKATQEEIDSVTIGPVFPDQKMYLIDESEGVVNGWTADNWYVEVTSQEEADAVIDAAAKMYGKPYDKSFVFDVDWKFVGLCRKNKDYTILRIGLTHEGAKPRPITDFIQKSGIITGDVRKSWVEKQVDAIMAGEYVHKMQEASSQGVSNLEKATSHQRTVSSIWEQVHSVFDKHNAKQDAKHDELIIYKPKRVIL